MKPFDTLTQTQLNAIINLIYQFYHKEITLNIDDPATDYCNLAFDIDGGEDAGTEIIFNKNDALTIGFTGQKLAGMNYQLRLFYYQLDKGDYSQTHDYGELQTMLVDLDSATVEVPFTDNQIYMQKDFELVIARETGYNLSLSAPSSALYGDNVKLTATLTLDSEPVPNTPITFYDGETQIGNPVNTDSNGVAEITVNNFTVATHTIHAECTEATSNNVNIIINRIPPVLTLTTQTQTITYGDSVTFTGTSALPANKEISIMQQNTEIATATIQSDGTFTATVTNIGDAGNAVFYADYAGDAIYADGRSNDLNITINKATPTLTVNAPSTVYIGESFDISGTLGIDYNGYALDIVGLTSYAYRAWVQNQEFDGTFTITTAGTYTVLIGSAETTNYYDVETTISIVATTRPTYDSIVLSAEKSVLSYKDNDKTDLYAQLQYNGSDVAVSGVTVTFKQGSTVLGTATTDVNGKATLTDGYTSTGVGDVSLTASDGSLSSEIYVEDCLRFDNALSDKTSNYSFKNNPNSSTIIYDSINHYYTFNYPSRVTESNASQLWLLQEYNGQDVEVMIDVCFEFTNDKQIVLYNYNQALEWNNHSSIGTWTSNSVCGSVISGSNYRDTSGTSLLANTWYTFKFRIKGNTIETYIIQNGSVIREKSTSAWSRTKINSVLALSDYVSWCRFKNVKIKPL